MAEIKISELEPTTDLEGLYTIGSDKNNLSKKVSLQFLREAADYAIEQGDYAKQEGSTIESRITDFKAETDAKLTELESEFKSDNSIISQSTAGVYSSEQSLYPTNYTSCLRVFAIAEYNMEKPCINLDVKGVVTFCVYSLDGGNLKLAYQRQVSDGLTEIPYKIQKGQYLALLDSTNGLVGYVKKPNNGFMLTKVYDGNLVLPQNEVILSSLEKETLFSLQAIVFDMGVITEKVVKIEKSLPSTSAVGSFPENFKEPSGQGYAIVKRIINRMSLPKLNVLSTGAFEFGVYRKNGETYSLIYKQSYSGNIKGQTINIALEIGDVVSVVEKSIEGGICYFTTSGGCEIIEVPLALPNAITEEDISYQQGYDFMFQIYEDTIIDNLQELSLSQSTIKEKFNKLNFISNKGIGLINNTIFADTLPTGWENNGFQLTSNGAISPSSAGVANILQFDQFSDLDASSLTCVINATTAPNILLTRYNKQYPSSGGFVVGFNFVEKRVVLYSPTIEREMPTKEILSFDIPFDFVAGQYVLSISNYAELLKFNIFGAGEIVEFYADARTFTSFTRPHDKYGIVHLGGSYVVKEMSFSSHLESEPDVLVVGDSITEGDTIRTEPNGGFENRWVGLLSQNVKVSVWAQGGNTSSNINTDLDSILSLFKPKKVIYAIGTNDGNYNTWLSNCQRFTEAFENIGAEVIYTTSVLRPAYESEHAKMREWIKASGHRYIDFCSAMSVNGLCVTNKNLFLSDKLHPTPEGHYQMYKAVISSLPDLQW